MNTLAVYARLYADCLSQAARALRKNAWTLLLPAGLYIAWGLLASLLAPLGILAGIALGLILSGLASCYLYFLGELVSHASVSINEVGRSLRTYFWSVANVFFVVWVATTLLGYLLRGNPNALVAILGLKLVALVLLSAAPEVIYQKGTYGGLATIERSVAFVHSHWIEWLLPTAAILALLYWILQLSLFGTLGFLITALATGAVMHFGMLFRGFLFQALDGTTHRQRMFKYRGSLRVGP
jgi:hypothetical protein